MEPDPRTHPTLTDRPHLWWACVFPERRDDGDTVYSDECPRCCRLPWSDPRSDPVGDILRWARR